MADFSLDTSQIAHSLNVSGAQTGLNLKKLQTLLFQTNFYMKKLEEKMNETQRTIDMEVYLRQLRSHQTVLLLKVNAETIDDSFMQFVTEKHSKLLAEVRKGLEKGREIGNLTQGSSENYCEMTDISVSQATPAFNQGKNFVFKDFDGADSEVADKLHEIFAGFLTAESEEQAAQWLEQGIFKLKYPRIAAVMGKLLKVLQTYRNDWKNERSNRAKNGIMENLAKVTGDKVVKEQVTKALALQELHLNLENLGKRKEDRQKTCISTQTLTPSLESEGQTKKVEDLELQLAGLTSMISTMRKEKESIERCQAQLARRLSKPKPISTSEEMQFYKDRFESANKSIATLQEAKDSLAFHSAKVSEELASRISCKHYADHHATMLKINDSRYVLSALIKDLEKNRFSLSPEQLNTYITQLHQVSLRLIINDFERTTPSESRPKSRSNSSLKSASEKLDLYLLTQ
jgi:hypothetical protein